MSANFKSRLYCTAAVIAVVSTTSGIAHAQTTGDNSTLEVVVVTGQRAAIESAIETKKVAPVIVDSVSAEDIGRLPDNSITEVLQRIPGVNISRIQTGGSSESYLGEGTQIQIRGLDSVVSQLNGRDSFSSANGRNLAWEDIPPELAQGVDVYKSVSAFLPEGGFGGIVNLRTRQPFDFDGLTVNATATANYADYAAKAHFGGVGLISDRWNTKIGEFGLLVNVAYSDLATRADGVQLSPYFPTVYSKGYPTNAGLPYVSSYGLTTDSTTAVPCTGNATYSCQEVYAPSAIDFNQRYDDRVRVGYYAAAQWKPSERLSFFLTGFRSRYTDNQTFHYIIVDGSGHTTLNPDSSITDTFDSHGNLLTAPLVGQAGGLANYMYADPGVGSSLGVSSGWGYQPIPYQFETSYDHSVNQTTDISAGGDWQPTDSLNIKFAVQHVESFATDAGKYAYLYAFLPGYGLQLSPYGSASLPVLTLPDVDLTNPNRFGWRATMDHLMDNAGQENAVYVDGLWDLSETSFFRSVKFGVKITDRREKDDETSYNFQDLTPWYGSGLATISAPHTQCFTVSPTCGYQSYGSLGALTTVANTNRAYASLFNTGSLFEGKSGLPAQTFFPSLTMLNTNYGVIHTYHGANANGLGGPGDVNQPIAFGPYDGSTLTETSQTLYAQVNFAQDKWRVPFSGNIGLRIVSYKDSAAGWFKMPFYTQPTEFRAVGSTLPPGGPQAQWTDCNTSGHPYSPYCVIPAPSQPDTLTFLAPQSARRMSGGHSEVDVLPSFNIQFQPTEELKVRLAASQGISRPTFAQLNPKGQVYGNYVGTYTSYFNGNLGNPNLKPEKAEQLDASIEYYFKNGGLIHISPFWKQIHNYINNAANRVDITIPTTVAGGTYGIPAGVDLGGGYSSVLPSNPLVCPVPAGGVMAMLGEACPQSFTGANGAVVIQPENESKSAVIEGFEVGLQKYADFLPDPFDGLGVDVNYTFIKSKQPGALAYDMKGNLITGLPLIGLSKNTVNAAVMFDKGPISMRVAYNWRDSFLVSTAAYQTAGTYNYVDNVAPAGQSIPQGASVRYALPVFQYPMGTLDANMTITMTDNISLSLEASNLTKTTARLFMGVGNRRENRSWYTADTRYTSQIRVKF